MGRSAACDRFTPTNSHDVVITSADYKQGPLSPFYYPQTGGNLSALINAGSTSAANVGLYHFTTITNLSGGFQIAETNSAVDLGFHLPALDSSNHAIDSDGDTIPNYVEDNGNGNPSDDPTSWLVYNSTNSLVTGNGLVVFTPLK